LAGALRREQAAESSLKKSAAEMEHLTRLVGQGAAFFNWLLPVPKSWCEDNFKWFHQTDMSWLPTSQNTESSIILHCLPVSLRSVDLRMFPSSVGRVNVHSIHTGG